MDSDERRKSGGLVAVVFTDLDSFKSVNETYGHDIGDELLVAMAGRLRGVLRSGDTVARLNGDEFMILCRGLLSVAWVNTIAARIDTVVSEPFVLSTVEVEVTCNVGIAFAGHASDIPEHIIEDAEAVMSWLKRNGDTVHPVFDLRDQPVEGHPTSLTTD